MPTRTEWAFKTKLNMDKLKIEERIIEVLKTVYDPEIQ